MSILRYFYTSVGMMNLVVILWLGFGFTPKALGAEEAEDA